MSVNHFDLSQYTFSVTCEKESTDTSLRFEQSKDELSVFLKADTDRPKFIRMHWETESADEIFVLGDTWERSYGNLEFVKLAENDRNMPWYFVATDRKESFCFGVKTQPNAFVHFRYDPAGVTAVIDCRNGGSGVHLGGRELKLCTFVCKRYPLPPMESLAAYCRTLCDAPLLPKEKIYGGNNWYYAYGESSYADIIRDAKLQAHAAEGIENRPFMVVDDGWQLLETRGPFVPNDKFRDMAALARDMRALGVRPGIWVRLLEDDSPQLTEEMRIDRGGKRIYLDPTRKDVQDYLHAELAAIRGWGYELLKHDFSTVDLFGDYGCRLPETITNIDGWHFADKSKTNAEIVLDFYRLIHDACGDMLLIGCNTVSHLCAGLVHIYRTGDDTSGREWARTREMGVNTLAFRLPQNNAFYVVDADCVGILDDNIPWRLNRQWMDLLAGSDTALFTSCAVLDEAQFADVRKAYLEIQKPHRIKPLDIYGERTPRKWTINDEIIEFDWEE